MKRQMRAFVTCQEGRIVLFLGYSSFNIQVAGFDCEFDSLSLQVFFSLCSTMHISGLISEGPLANPGMAIVALAGLVLSPFPLPY